MTDKDFTLTAADWHLLQSMLQDRIRQAEADGLGADHPSSQYRRTLSEKLLHHELRMRKVEHPGWPEMPELLRSMSYEERLRLTEEEWAKAYEAAKPSEPEILFLLWSNKHQKWWAANQRGYASSIEEAGRYTEAEAIRCVAKSAFHGRLDQVTCMVADTAGTE